MTKQKNSRLLLYGLVFVVFFASFLYRFVNFYHCMTLLLVLFCFFLRAGGCIRMQARWLFYIMAVILASIVGIDFGESFKYVFLFFSITIVTAAAKTYHNYRKVIMRLFYVFSFFHSLLILAQYIAPTQFSPFIITFVPPEVAERAIGANINGGVCTGLAGESAFAMLYSSITFYFGFIKYLNEKKKIYILAFVIGLISTLLTGKRIAVAINVVAGFVTYIMTMKSRQKSAINNTLIMVFFVIVIGSVLVYTDLGHILLEKNEILEESGDITNGRAELTDRMLQIFKDNVLLGIGPFCTTKYSGEYLGHNIYLTTLSENGLIGFFFIVVLLLLNFVDSIKRYKTGDNSTYMYLSIFVQLFFIIYGFTGNPLYGTQFLTTYILFSYNENRNTYIPSRK